MRPYDTCHFGQTQSVPTETTGLSLKDRVYHFATEVLDFDDCRFTSPFIKEDLKKYKEWLASGFHADMEYLEDHLEFKENPELLLKGVQSAIVLIKNYKNTPIRQLTGKLKIARYAVGKDYHPVMRDRMRRLVDFLTAEEPDMKCYPGVDSRPISERSLALKAGIGFLGKNTMVIKPGLGSYFFIGVILTDHSFENDSPLNWSCGSCRLCLDACPTGALVPTETFSNTGAAGSGGTSAPRFPSALESAPVPLKTSYCLDATKCISYMTIEKKTPMSDDELKKTKGWLFGCDICQEVCPYNHGQIPLTDWKEFHPAAGVGFDFFEKKFRTLQENDIPQDTPLHRSRKRVIPNWNLSRQIFKSQ